MPDFHFCALCRRRHLVVFLQLAAHYDVQTVADLALLQENLAALILNESHFFTQPVNKLTVHTPKDIDSKLEVAAQVDFVVFVPSLR